MPVLRRNYQKQKNGGTKDDNDGGQQPWDCTHTHTQAILNNVNKEIHRWENYLLVYVFAVRKNYARDG